MGRITKRARKSLSIYKPIQSNLTVFPLIGGMGDDYIDIHSNQLCFDLARKMRAKAKYLYAPALVSNEQIKKDLQENPTIHAVFEESKKVDCTSGNL